MAPLLDVGEEGEEEDDILDNREPSRGQRSVALEYLEMRPGRPRFGLKNQMLRRTLSSAKVAKQ